MSDTKLQSEVQTVADPGDSPVLIYALGGLGEIGKNCYCIENDNDIVILDSGVKFPEYNDPGVSYIIPDFTHLAQNERKIRALCITHGHEDHIGSIPFLLQTVRVPVIYAPRLACALIKNKLAEYNLGSKTQVVEVDENSNLVCGSFKVQFFHVTHSIPDAFGIYVTTPQGTVATTGDFKIDLTPVDHDFDMSRLTRFGDQGIDLLMADSTNAEKEGYTPSEKNVKKGIDEVFSRAMGRLIISTFASNLSRITQITQCAIKHGRKVCVMGRSMEGNLKIARDLGIIKISDSSLVDPDRVQHLPASQVCILCTGSQGEPLAALSRIATGTHRYIRILPGDTIVFSSHPIPGNTASVNKVVDDLIRAGANVITDTPALALHSSGHASKVELRLLQKLARPKYFMPIHGEYRMLVIHCQIAQECGLDPSHTFVMRNGETLVMYKHEITRGKPFTCEALYIDGKSPMGVLSSVIRDSTILIDEGIVVVFVRIDHKANKLLFRPTVESRGILISNKSSLERKTEEAVSMELDRVFSSGQKVTYSLVKETIRNTASHFIYREIHRNPMIVSVIASIGSAEAPRANVKTIGYTSFPKFSPTQPKDPIAPGKEGI